MKKLVNTIAPILKNVRYRNKADPFLKFKELRKNEKIPVPINGNVLILPIRMAPVSNLLEGIYGYAMKLRGYSVHALVCKQALNKCDHMYYRSDNIVNCTLCNYEQKRFIDTFGFIEHTYESCISKHTIEKIKSIIKHTPTSKILTLEYDSIQLGKYIESALMRHLLLSEIDVDKFENLARKFMFTALMTFEVTRNVLLKIKPKYVLASHGMYSTWGVAMAACNYLNIPIVIWGRGYIGGNIIANHNISYLFERMYEPTKYWENITLSIEQKEKLYNYYEQKKNPNSSVDYSNYYSNLKKSQKSVIEQLNLDKKRVKFGLFPNIPYDGTLHSTSKTFPSIILFLKTTLEWFLKHQECDLIIRAHPVEANPLYSSGDTIKNLIDSVIDVLPNNIYFIEATSQISSYDVESICDCSLLYAGTMALEFAITGKVVIQGGMSNSSNKGFIFEPNSIEHYQELLLKASIKELIMSNEMKERAEKYAYHWLYKRHIPETTYKHKGLTFTEFNIENSMDLAPGKNKVVDFFINRCEDGKPFIWENDA